MQKSLLGAAIALILVLVTALVGPLFVDWGRYRETFETEITRLTRSDVRIGGPIDVRLLPVPTLRLQQIEIGQPDGHTQVRAESLRVELALGPLMHGEFVASDVALETPEILLGLAGPARERPASSLAFDPRTVSIAHLTVQNGRLVLTGGPNGTLVLDRLEFSGEAGSLLGPAKGEGSVAVGGESYLYAIDAGRASGAGAARMRVRIDTVDHARRGDVDGTVWIEQGVPHLVGDLRWSQTARRSAQGFNEPWRLSAKMQADWAAVALEEIDLQYGAEDRGIHFRGRAGLKVRAQPELDVMLAAGRMDIDRMLALPATLRRPLASVHAMAEALGEAALPPIQVNFGLSADAVTLADATLERVSAHLRGKGSTWDLDSLDLLAPGGTQVQLRGRLDRTAKGPAFDGEGRVETRDARPLVSWLANGGGGGAFAAPFSAVGRVRLSKDSIALDRFSALFDRDTVEGNISYATPNAGRSGQISATLSASMIDLDRVSGLIQRVAGDANVAWPREGSLSLNVQRMSVGGIEAKGADISVRFNEQALTVDRLMIDDFAGSRVGAVGSVDIRTLAPRGAVTLDIEVRRPDGLAAAVEKFSAPLAAALRGAAGRLLPANLHGAFGGDAQAAREAGIPDGAAFRINGSAGAFGLDLKGVAELPLGDGLPAASLGRLAHSKVAVAGRVDVHDGRALMEAAGLDRLLDVDDRAGRLDFEALGSLGGPMAATAQVTAGGLDVSLNGTLRAAQSQLTNADLALAVTQANVRVAQAGTLPVKFTARLNYDGGTIGLDQIAGMIAGSDIAGHVALGMLPAMHFDGDIRLGAVDVPAILAAAVGAPAKRTSTWSAQPFAGGVLGQFRGRISLASAGAVLMPNLAARNLRGVLNFGPLDVALDDVEADIAGGHVSGRIAFERDGDELGVTSRARLREADIAALLPGNRPLASGRLDLEAELEGRGRSPAALVGSLQGRGSFRIENGNLAQLDPAAFDAVVRSVDEGLPIEVAHIREYMEAALARGVLTVQGDGAIIAADGMARLAAVRLQAESADLAISANYDFPTEALDARLTLVAPARASTTDIGRPEIAIRLQGPIDSPRRTLDVAALSAWLSTRAAAENAKRLAANPRPDDVRPAASPPALRQTAQPVGPASPAAVARPSAPLDSKTEAAPPTVTNPGAATGTVAAIRPETQADPAPAARDAVAVGTPDVANPAASEPPADPRIAELDRAIAANPRDGAAFARRGQMFALRRNYGSAIRDFDEAIRLRPRDVEALNNRCWARAIVGDLQSALSDCNAALQLRPGYADAFDSRGMINLKSGQLSDAIADYDAALRINPKLASSLYGRGIARIRSDNLAGGNLDIGEARALQPNIAEEFAGYGIR
jgi:AsmA-like C-terminal region/AsmA family